MSQSGRLKVESLAQARRMATTSACAVGSLVEVTSFQPSAIISSPRTMMAPNGPPLLARIRSSASARVRVMNFSWLIKLGLDRLVDEGVDQPAVVPAHWPRRDRHVDHGHVLARVGPPVGAPCPR